MMNTPDDGGDDNEIQDDDDDGMQYRQKENKRDLF